MRHRGCERGIWVFVAAIALFPNSAKADAMIPYMVVPWGQVFLFPVVVIVEAVVLRTTFVGRFAPVLFQSFVANLASTLVGSLMYLATMNVVGERLFYWWFKGGFGTEAIRNAVIALAFAGVLWFVSWIVESAVIRRMRRASSIREVFRPVALANVVTYVLLLGLAISFQR